MPEHLRLEQHLGERGAVHGHHRPAGAATVVMDELGDQLLAAAAFAGDEHRGVGGGDAPGEGDHLVVFGRAAEHRDAVAGLDATLLMQHARFPRDRDGVRSASDEDLQLAARERLWQKVPRAGPQHLQTRFHGRLAGDDDRDRVRVGGERGGEQLAAAHRRHVEIEQDDVEGTAPQQLEGFLTTAGDRDVVAFDAQHARAALAQRALVVGDENTDAGLRGGLDRNQLRQRARRRGRCGTRNRH